MSQGMWEPLTTRKGRGVGSPLKPPGGMQLSGHLDFRMVGPQERKRVCVAFSH